MILCLSGWKTFMLLDEVYVAHTSVCAIRFAFANRFRHLTHANELGSK